MKESQSELNKYRSETLRLSNWANGVNLDIEEKDKKYESLIKSYSNLHNSKKQSESAETQKLQITTFLLGVEIERIRKLYIERENECIQLESE